MKKSFALIAAICAALSIHAQLNYVWHHSVSESSPPQWFGGIGIADFVEGTGNQLFVAGVAYQYPDVDPGNGTTIIPADSQLTAYIAAYTSGGIYVTSWYIPTTQYSVVRSITPCDNGDIIAVGDFAGTVDFDPGVNVSSAFSLYNDGFIARYSSGGQLIWVKTFGLSTLSRMQFSSVAEEAGEICAVGYLMVGDSVDVNPGTGTNMLYVDYNLTGLILKLDAAGNYQWSFQLGGSVGSVDISSTGEIAVCGQTKNYTDFHPGPLVYGYNTQCTTFGDFFAARYTSAGAYVWHYAVGSGGETYAWGIEYDSQGDIYVGGYGSNLDMQPGPGIALTYNYDFVVKYDNGMYDWQTGLALQMELDSLDNFYCTDGTSMKCYSSSGSVLWTNAVPTACTMIETSVTGNIYLGFADYFTGDLDPGTGVVNHTGTTGSGYVVLALKYGPVGMEEHAPENAVTLFPTVTSDIITVSGVRENSSYSIYNNTGQVVLSGITYDNVTSISVEGLSEGVYYFVVPGEFTPQSFIVQ